MTVTPIRWWLWLWLLMLDGATLEAPNKRIDRNRLLDMNASEMTRRDRLVLFLYESKVFIVDRPQRLDRTEHRTQPSKRGCSVSVHQDKSMGRQPIWLHVIMAPCSIVWSGWVYVEKIPPDVPPRELWQVIAAFMARMLGLTGRVWDYRIGTGSSHCGGRLWRWPRFVGFANLTLASLRIATSAAPRSGMRWPLCGWAYTGKGSSSGGDGKRRMERMGENEPVFIVVHCHDAPGSTEQVWTTLVASLSISHALSSSPCTPTFPNIDLTRPTSRYAVSWLHPSDPTNTCARRWRRRD